MRAITQQPDLILVARRCYTLRSRGSRSDAIAIGGGRVLAVGTRRAIRRRRGPGTRVIDLGAQVITPGIVDAHTHFFYWALGRALVIDVSKAKTLEQTLKLIHRGAARRTIDDWVVALGFDYNAWGRELPRARDLDRAVAERPVLVHSRDGHTVWLNSVAMRRAKINRKTRDPQGGRFLRDRHGRPTGIVQEAALAQLPDPLTDFARRNDRAVLRIVDRALRSAYRAAWSLGIVGVHVLDDAASLSHLQRQHAAGGLGLHVVHSVPLENLEHARALGLRTGLGDDWLRIGGIKIFADGALGSQTAYMFKPYPGRPGYCGVPVLAGKELRETVLEAARSGWAVWIHAIGDRAVHDAITAINAARRVEAAFLPHRIEHAQCVRPADVRRMAKARIIASVQPAHVMGDIRTADRHWPRARRNAYPFRNLLNAGVRLALGSDVPIESIDPRCGLYGAAVRADEQGEPQGGWFAAQQLTVREAIEGFTIGAAAAVGAPSGSGTIAPGVPADLTVWQDDPFKVPPEDLLYTRIAGCVVNGELHLKGIA